MTTKKLINTILQQVHIENDTLFYIGSREFRISQKSAYWQWHGPMSSFGENTGSHGREREKLVSELAGALYSGFYTTGKPEGEWRDEQPKLTAEEKSDFMNQLSEANCTQENWDPAWTVVSNGASGAVVQKNGVSRQLVNAEWQPLQPLDGPLQAGMQVSVLLRKERKDLQPVFYYVYSSAPFPQPASLCRVYFNIKPDHIHTFIRDFTTLFNHYSVPFMFKCLNHPLLYTRADSAVLYLEKNRFAIASRLLLQLIKKHSKAFAPTTPLFTKPLAKGVSFAEDPGNGKSFGMSWCELLAEGAVKFYETSASNATKKESLILELIKKNGLLLEAPHMKANSFYPYNFSLFKL